MLDSWLSDAEMKCRAFGGFDMATVLPGSTNPNAPWVLQGTWRRQTTGGAVSMGFVGVRNYALPLSAAGPIGGHFDPGLSGGGRSGVLMPSSQWYVTAAVEKTLATSSNGSSVSVTADLVIPVETESLITDDPRVGALTSRTVRSGIMFRW